MKKSIFFLLLCLAFFACSKPVSHPYPSGSLADQLREDPHRFGVTLHSYEFFDLEDTPAPRGYQPFYISHYGRHGSRSNWGDKDYRRLIAVLDSARQEGVLTPAGEQLLDITNQVLASYNDMDGRLTDRGEREHAMLATRMYHRYPEVWNVKEPRVISVGSLVPRSIISMTSFTNTLSKLNSHISYNFDCGEQMQKYIDCCGHESPEFKAQCQALEDSVLATLPYDDSVVIARLFTAYPQALVNQDLRHFQRKIYHTCVIAQDFDIDANLLDYMDFSSAYYHNLQSTLHVAIRKRNTVGGGLERIYHSQIALDEIIHSADSAIATFASSPKNPIVANLRFGHDYPLLFIVSGMNISGVGDTLEVSQLEHQWPAHLNICMASNLQLIFYKKHSSPILVKVLYNEREHLINGLTPVSGPYYRWDDVKAKWQH